MSAPVTENKKTFLDVQETADVTGVSVVTLYRLVSQGRIPHYRIGGSLRFNLPEILEASHRGGE